MCAALAAAALLLAAACGDAAETAPRGAGVSASPTATPRSGGTYNHPLDYDVGSLLPFRAWELDSSTVVAHEIYEGLTAYETQSDGSVATVPCLAQSWSANADASVWTFRLRRGVLFQAPVDREVTAHDVVAGFRFAADPRNEAADGVHVRDHRGDGRRRVLMASDAEALGVEALDRYTVRFTLKAPFAVVPGDPRHPVRLGLARRLSATASAGCVSSSRRWAPGPFVLSRRVRGGHIDLARNPDWWNALSGQPHLRVRPLRSVRERDREAARLPEGVHRLHLGAAGPGRGLPIAGAGEERRVGGSQSPRPWGCGTWASTWATRWSAASAACLCGRRSPARWTATRWSRRSTTASTSRRRASCRRCSPAGAMSRRRRTSTPRRPGDSTKPPAAPSCGSSASRDNREALATAEWLRSACAAAGIRLRLRPVSWEKVTEFWGTERMPALFLSGWIADYPSADNFLHDLFQSRLSPSTSGTSYSDADVDRLLSLARSTSDPGRHYDLNRRAAAEIMADLPRHPAGRVRRLPAREHAARRVHGQPLLRGGHVEAVGEVNAAVSRRRGTRRRPVRPPRPPTGPAAGARAGPRPPTG